MLALCVKKLGVPKVHWNNHFQSGALELSCVGISTCSVVEVEPLLPSRASPPCCSCWHLCALCCWTTYSS